MKRLLLLAIRGYQAAVSPAYGVACRYEPSCSNYMHQAIELHGAVRGTWLGLRRLSRCRPGGGSGYDPVPPARHRDGADADAGATRANESESPAAGEHARDPGHGHTSKIAHRQQQ
jgi:uncharacterized protein